MKGSIVSLSHLGTKTKTTQQNTWMVRVTKTFKDHTYILAKPYGPFL